MSAIIQSMIESIIADDVEKLQNLFKDYLTAKTYFLHFYTPKEIFIPIQLFLFDVSILKNSENCSYFIGNFNNDFKIDEDNPSTSEELESDDDPLKNAFVYNAEFLQEEEENEISFQNSDLDAQSSDSKEIVFIEITEHNSDIAQLFFILLDHENNEESLDDHTSLVKWLFQSKYSIKNYPETIFDALYLAANTNNLNIVDYLLYQGVDASQISKYGTTIFNGAVFRKNYDLIELLTSYNIEQTSDEMGRFPLHMATKLMNIEMTEYLLEIGGDPSVIDNRSFTPLHLAAKVGCAPIIDLLIDYGAFINKPDRYGRTPLHIAALYGQLSSCQALYNNGAVMEAIDKHGLTPMNFATMRNKKKVMKFFDSLGLNNTNIEKDYQNRPKRRPKKHQDLSKNAKSNKMLKIIHSLR